LYENNPSHCCKDNVPVFPQCQPLPGYYEYNLFFKKQMPGCISPVVDYPASKIDKSYSCYFFHLAPIIKRGYLFKTASSL